MAAKKSVQPKMTKGLQSKVPAKTVRKKPETKKEAKDIPDAEESETENLTKAQSVKSDIISEKLGELHQSNGKIEQGGIEDVVTDVPEEPVQKITEKISVKYVFTQEEIGEKGIQLGRLHQNVEQIKDEIKEIVSQKKSQIDQSNAQINELSRHVTNGYTFIDEVCNVKLMDP